MTAGGYTLIGRVVGAHGLRGELRVFPVTSFPERFRDLERVFVQGPEGREAWPVDGARGIGGKHVLLKLTGVDDRTAAEAFKGRELLVPDEERVRLPEGAFFQADLVGCAVVDEEGGPLGEVADFSEDAGGLLVVRLARGKRLVDVPFVDVYVASVDVAGRRVALRAAWRGLLDPEDAG